MLKVGAGIMIVTDMNGENVKDIGIDVIGENIADMKGCTTMTGADQGYTFINK